LTLLNTASIVVLRAQDHGVSGWPPLAAFEEDQREIH
jgi:hypothetical protein